MAASNVRVVGSCIYCQSQDYGSWLLRIYDIRVVGEMTTSEGPYLDDHFVVFIDAAGDCHVVSVSADGLRDSLHLIGLELGGDILLELQSVDYDSIVHWPAALRGKKLFSIKHEIVEEGGSRCARARNWIRATLGLDGVSIEYSDQVLKLLD